jgi:hypothetical protein
VARDWSNEISTVQAMVDRLAALAPNNAAPIPMSVTLERDDLGRLVWVTDIHVHIKGVTEYEVQGVHETYTGSIRRAYLGLSNEPNQRRLAATANAHFKVKV